MSILHLKAPAKINLSLHILGRRANGYHDLSMIMEKVSLCDEITLEKIDSGIELVTGPWPAPRRSGSLVPAVPGPKEENLAYKSAALLQNVSASSCASSCGVRITLTKNIPMGGGLGGGSSDAATVLKGLNTLWNLNWPPQKLAEIGVKLGADVPFFIYDGPALVEGIGDEIKPLDKLPNLWIILVNPGVHVATPWAYSAWDNRRSVQNVSASSCEPGKNLTEKNQSVRSRHTLEEVIQVLHNDFESVVIPEYPEIQRVKEALLKAGALGALMSGSGSTVFGLFETKETRDNAVNKIEKKPEWQVFAVDNWGVDKR
ncbi:MAG: 4-(cytidine 5'-diphospho)-2-C-methyl-D-erythritol kinase [Deltaproteobacteria bacterium]|nr:4-(cytidine 5'-diphospho)-2-C-methyl-D-erythritol kinase [Deltaproteobacteria bacterium]